MSNNVVNYGWDSNSCDPESCNYLTPAVINVLKRFPKVNKVCDLGCGNGSLLLTLADKGYETSGIEYDLEGYKISSTRNPNTNIYNLGVEDSPDIILKKENVKFDAVIATEVIEHLYSPHLLPQFSSKILNKGGYLIITTPYHGYLKNLALSIFNKWDFHHTPLWHGGHIKFWSKSTLNKLLTDNNFQLVYFNGAGRIPYLWKSMLVVAKLK